MVADCLLCTFSTTFNAASAGLSCFPFPRSAPYISLNDWTFADSFRSVCHFTVGNIVAPYLFKAKDAPNYKPAMEGMLVLYVILALAIVLQAFNLIWAQKRKEKSRVAMGLPAKIVDHSMDVHFKTAEDPDETHREHGEEGFDDRTDRQNPYFT